MRMSRNDKGKSTIVIVNNFASACIWKASHTQGK